MLPIPLVALTVEEVENILVTDRALKGPVEDPDKGPGEGSDPNPDRDFCPTPHGPPGADPDPDVWLW